MYWLRQAPKFGYAGGTSQSAGLTCNVQVRSNEVIETCNSRLNKRINSLEAVGVKDLMCTVHLLTLGDHFQCTSQAQYANKKHLDVGSLSVGMQSAESSIQRKKCSTYQVQTWRMSEDV